MSPDRAGKKSRGDASDEGWQREPIVDEHHHGSAPDTGRASEQSRQAGDRAFDARRTQPGSRGGRPIYAPVKGARYVGESLNAQGNELALRRREKGRIFEGEQGPGRPVGRSTPRFVTGVNPLDSITGFFLPRA